MATDNRAFDPSFETTPTAFDPESWNLLRAVVDTAPECIKVVAKSGELMQMNPAGLRLIDASSWEAAAGASVFDLIAPEHRQTWREFHERVCCGETLTWRFDIIGLTGIRRHMETSAVPISLSDGSLGQLAFTHDVTARQELEHRLQQTVSDRTKELLSARQQLKETERSLELLIDSVTDHAIYMLDPEGRVASWNAGARRMTGYEAAEIIGQHFSCFYTEEDRIANVPTADLKIASRDGKIEREGWRIRRDGSRFFANVITDVIRNRGELVGFAKITRDITEKRVADARLRQAQKMEAIGQFTGGAAHDFSNLLMAISGSLELLRKQLPEDQRMQGLLDNAVQASKRGISLTQGMLAFARRQELKLEAVDVIALIEGVRALLERSVGPAVRIDTRFHRPVSAVRTDPNQLETALLNLAVNARDAMPSGGTIIISADETIVESGDSTHLSPGRYTRLFFSDTGHGMDEATLARVIEPFFTTKGVGKGTGLGLAMVDSLCAQSGGKLAIQSRLYQGTTVELWLPLAQASIAGVQIQSAEAEKTFDSSLGRRLKVLLVDDDSLVLTSSAAMLEDLGHDVIGVLSGEKALEIVATGTTTIDLVIADQIMSGMTGLELAHTLRSLKPSLPVLLVTGHSELPPDSEIHIPRLAKPFNQCQLAQATEDCLRMER